MSTVIKNGVNIRKALKKYEPDLAKATQKELGKLLKVIVQDARGFIPSSAPLSGWEKNAEQKGRWSLRAWNPIAVSRGISFRTSPTRRNRRGFQYLASIVNKSAAGAIYETAGRKTGMQSDFSSKLEKITQGKTQKTSGRLIFAAWKQDQGKTNAAVIKALETSADKFYAATYKKIGF